MVLATNNAALRFFLDLINFLTLSWKQMPFFSYVRDTFVFKYTYIAKTAQNMCNI